MATLSETWQKFKGAIVTGLSSLVVAAIGSAGYGIYTGVSQAFADLAPRSYVHEVVDAALAERDAIRDLERQIRREEELLTKVEGNEEATADVQARIADLQTQLEALRE